MLLEERVAEDLLKIGRQAVLAVIGESGELDIEDLRRLQEQIGRKLALIMLYQVEITRRNAESGCDFSLREPLAATQTAYFCAQSRLHLNNLSQLYIRFFTMINILTVRTSITC